MTVGILGLGLIGGSLARAYALAGHTVYAADKDESILSFAQLAGAVDAQVDLQAKTVTVTGSASAEALKEAIANAGYEVIG